MTEAKLAGIGGSSGSLAWLLFRTPSSTCHCRRVVRARSRRRASVELKELRRLAEAGTPPHVYALLPDHAALVETRVRTHGPLGAARDAAGLARGRPTEARETVVASLSALSDRAVRLAPPRTTASAGKSRRARPARRRAGVAARGPDTQAVGRQIGALVAAFVAQLVEVAVADAHRQAEHAFTARLPKRPVARAAPMLTVPRAQSRQGSPASSMALDPIRLHAVLSRVTGRHHLSPREALVLAAMVHGIPRSRLAERLGTGENTVKTQVKTLLEKIGKDSLGEAVWWIRAQVEGATPRRRLA